MSEFQPELNSISEVDQFQERIDDLLLCVQSIEFYIGESNRLGQNSPASFTSSQLDKSCMAADSLIQDVRCSMSYSLRLGAGSNPVGLIDIFMDEPIPDEHAFDARSRFFTPDAQLEEYEFIEIDTFQGVAVPGELEPSGFIGNSERRLFVPLQSLATISASIGGGLFLSKRHY